MRFWTTTTYINYRGEERWAKLRVKTYEATGEDYFDILIGKHGKKAHVHMGIGLDMRPLFTEDRGLVHKIARRMEQQQKGVLEDKQVFINADVNPAKDLIFKVDVNPNTGEVTVRDFAIKE